MGDFKINEKTVFTQSGSAEPAMGSTITGIPAAGVTGVLPSAVTGGSGLTALGIIQVKSGTYTGQGTVTTEGSYTTGHLEFALTPILANSSYFFIANCFFGISSHDTTAEIGFVVSGGSPGGVVTPRGVRPSGDTYGDQVFAISGIGTPASSSLVDDWWVGTTPAHFLWTPASDLGVGTRTFSVGAGTCGSGGTVKWNGTYIGTDESAGRNLAPVSVLTVFEINALAIAD